MKWKTSTWTLVCGLGFSLAALGTMLPTLAQTATTPPSPFEQNKNDDLSSIFNNNGGTGGASLLNLINRIQLLNGQSPGEFALEQQDSINDAAAAFRSKQLQQIQQPGLTNTPAEPETSEEL